MAKYNMPPSNFLKLKTKSDFRQMFTHASKGHEFYSKIAMINIPASSIAGGYLNRQSGG